jgi:hypothetical protein
MVKALVLLSFVLASTTAMAEWSKIFSGFNPTAYADLDALARSGDIATMPVLVDFKKPPFDGNNLPYLSLKMKAEYNCKTVQFRLLELASYSGHMATGHKPYTTAEPTEWKIAGSEGIQKPLWDAACQQLETNQPTATKKSAPNK